MANDDNNPLATGALLLGRFLVERWLDERWRTQPPQTLTPHAPLAPSAPLPIGIARASIAQPAPREPYPSPKSHAARTSPTSTRAPQVRSPIQPSPSKGRVSMNASAPPNAGPITSPLQVDAQRVIASGPITSPSQLDASVISASQLDTARMTAAPIAMPVQTGPITSPSQLSISPDTAASAALGFELANLLTSTTPSASSSRPSKPSTTAPAQLSTSQAKPPGPFDLEIGPVQMLSPSISSALPRDFDPVFERYRGSIPIEYLHALVQRESSFNSNARTGSAVGLMQIIPVVLDDYNKRHGTHYQREHLTDPSINVAIGCELLRIVITSYRRNHPRVPNLQANWNNPRFVELLTFGWVAGYSEAGGVGRVARYLESIGVTDLTIDRLHGNAQAAGASKHLSNAAKVRWCKSVVGMYLRERKRQALSHRSAS
jgi:hypothetical protein